MVQIVQNNNHTHGSFIALIEEEPAGKLVYTWRDNLTLIIDHTEVDHAFSGQGVGRLLVASVVEFARLHQIRLIANCPYAKRIFSDTDEFDDVLVMH